MPPQIVAEQLPDTRKPIARPGLRFLCSHPAHFLALGAGAGLSPRAPGTFGTLFAWGSFLLLQPWMMDRQWGLLLAVSLLAGCWICALSAQHLGVADPGCVVWDEIAAFWLILWLISPCGLGEQLAAFVLFRYFDAAKPGPVAWADERFKGFGLRGGFGIMFDDVVAAFCTLLVLALWHRMR